MERFPRVSKVQELTKGVLVMMLALLYSVSFSPLMMMHADAAKQGGFVVKQSVVTSSKLRDLKETVEVETGGQTNLLALRISSDGQHAFVFGKVKKDGRETYELWLIRSQPFKTTGHYVFLDPVPVPQWTTSKELTILQGGSGNSQALVFSVEKDGSLLKRKIIPTTPKDAVWASEAEQVMNQGKYLWPNSPHGPLGFRALQFDNKRGNAVASNKGDAILASVRDEQSLSGAKSILLTKNDNTWIEHKLGNQRFPIFNLYDQVFAIYESSPTKECKLFNRATLKQIGSVHCDVFDLGPGEE